MYKIYMLKKGKPYKWFQTLSTLFGRSAFQWIHHLEIIIHIDEHSNCLGLLLVFKKVYACTTWMLNYRRNESKLLFIQHICAYLFAKSISFWQYYPPLKRQIAISKCTYSIILHLIIFWFNPELRFRLSWNF